MPRTELEYPKEPYGTVKRYSPRASYALRTIHTIINTSPILHVSFNDPQSPFPTILPMLGQMGSFSRPSADEGDVLDLYLHGYVSSRLVNISRQPSDASSTSSPSSPPPPSGLPVCIAASHLDGLVLALTPNAHSYNYRSAVLFGHATLVSDPAERLYAMQLITDGVVPGRWEASRVPPNKGELSSTSVLKVRIATGSAKIREGPPGDDRADKEDAKVTGRVWTGVVPVYQVLGEPVAGPYNEVAEVPGYLGEYVRETNAVTKEAAFEAARKVVVKKGGEDE
ncbi:flavin-nucleotide-binding protein [Colletotrichum scovillei]|uniref:Flavin-nucleotide-binding protein n=1 Tax=Colletotrichum scovillei TaxID=1209932 RepID=A0A9P7UBU1_9PEZI|nr:flavin-nucleotide-binding protein [Colletotrichum scovillei]KAF4780725.1 flavin-nucleotide-binding protein [Colletotrichum scovillei]KAG7045444.1 flavin-nucleotide-binding protein [Colletotrichum scovillei]KAG7052607.1 flavin-nucleotide-binding protein [Colletotrichum scovillei]KAG7064897.1 flavin-nucleotide-binding protein [Colletotrichum scovillei]